ncbi:MAG: ribonuclease III [Patescibacteria group bacterium]
MDLENLEKKLGISFKNKNLLQEALTHRSYLNEHPNSTRSSNERLEFLGDAILEFLISRLLFKQFPNSPEGVLTAFRSRIVQTKTLSRMAQKFSLGEFLFLSRGEEEGGGRKNSGLLENAFEALVGAIFLDQGIDEVNKFVKENFEPEILSLKPSDLKDAKSLLQELAQEKEKITPTYKVLSQVGPDHAKMFTVGVYLGEEKIGEGAGLSKQKAEEEAAKAALKIYVS